MDVAFAGPWTHHPGGLALIAGPGVLHVEALRRWLERGCSGPVPVRQGFVAALRREDGAVDIAVSARWEQSAYYAITETGVVLGVHPRDLLAALPSRPALNITKLADLVSLHDDPQTTAFTGVQRIPLGHVLRVSDAGDPRLRRWFAPTISPDRSIRIDDAPALMRSVIRDAVAASLPPSGDLAATLSGGLDSGTVAATAATVLEGSNRAIHAFVHAPVPGTGDPNWLWQADDRPYAAAVARAHGLELNDVVNEDLISPVQAEAWAHGRAWQPTFNPPNQPWFNEIVRRSEALGVPLLLTGGSGNATYSREPDGILRGLARRGHLGALARQVALRRTDVGTGRAVRSVLAEVAPPAAIDRWRRWRHGTRPHPAQELPVVLDALTPAARGELDQALAESALDRGDWIDFALFDASRMGLPQCLSPTVWWSDPLSDPEVIALALRLPEEAWLAGGRDRGLAREAASGLLPDQVRLRRTKGAQSADVGRWVREQEYRDLIDRFRASPSVPQFLDIERLRASIAPAMTDPDTALLWQGAHGRAFSVGHFAVWYEDEVLGRSA